MRFHDALLYRRRLAEYYANCSPPSFPLLPFQLRRPPQQPYDGSSPDGNAGAAGPPSVAVVASAAASQSTTSSSLLSRADQGGETDQPAEVSLPSPSMPPLFGALFSYLHPSLTAAAAAAMAHWYLGAGAAVTRPPHALAATDPLSQRAGGPPLPDWAVRLRVEDLLRARSAAAAAMRAAGSSSAVSSEQYDDGPWMRRVTERGTENVHNTQHGLGVARVASTGADTTTSSDVTFRPYLPDVRRSPLLQSAATDLRCSPDTVQETSTQRERLDADIISSTGSKTPDHELAGSPGDSVSVSGSAVHDAGDGRNSSELINMERMVHGLKHVQTAAIEELSKVADSY